MGMNSYLLSRGIINNVYEFLSDKEAIQLAKKNGYEYCYREEKDRVTGTINMIKIWEYPSIFDSHPWD